MNDDLDQKSEPELNEIVAVEIAGWRFNKATGKDRYMGKRGYLDLGHDYVTLWKDGTVGGNTASIEFCSDANLIIPWLEKVRDKGASVSMGMNTLITLGRMWWVGIIDNATNRRVEGIAQTFPRASAIALIRSVRASK